MTLKDLLTESPYNRKILNRFENPKNCGTLTPKTAMPLIIGKSQKKEEGITIALYMLLDSSDGIIADCKFQAIAHPLLIAALDVTCELLLRKNYEQARRISPTLILKQLDDAEVDLALVLSAIEDASIQCENLGLAKTVVTPVKKDASGNITHDWDAMTQSEKIALIEQVIQEDVRPYIQLDEGDIEILELKDQELHIAFQGACTSC
jgi:NifU-like protein